MNKFLIFASICLINNVGAANNLRKLQDGCSATNELDCLLSSECTWDGNSCIVTPLTPIFHVLPFRKCLDETGVSPAYSYKTLGINKQAECESFAVQIFASSFTWRGTSPYVCYINHGQGTQPQFLIDNGFTFVDNGKYSNFDYITTLNSDNIFNWYCYHNIDITTLTRAPTQNPTVKPLTLFTELSDRACRDINLASPSYSWKNMPLGSNSESECALFAVEMHESFFTWRIIPGSHEVCYIQHGQNTQPQFLTDNGFTFVNNGIYTDIDLATTISMTPKDNYSCFSIKGLIHCNGDILIFPDILWSCCTSENPCPVGEGNCDTDDDCAGHLKCGVDNCLPIHGWGYPEQDCCYDPDTNPCDATSNDSSNCCTQEKPCGKKEGNCNSDAECDGRLACGTNNCLSDYGWGLSTYNCCYKPSNICNAYVTVNNGNTDDCCEHNINMCGRGQGNCDSDDQCGDLVCGSNNCLSDFGWGPPTHNCCYNPHDICYGLEAEHAIVLQNGIGDAPKQCCGIGGYLCTEGEGDCDSDDECEDLLKCGSHNCVDEFGWGTELYDCCYDPTKPRKNIRLGDGFETG